MVSIMNEFAQSLHLSNRMQSRQLQASQRHFFTDVGGSHPSHAGASSAYTVDRAPTHQPNAPQFTRIDCSAFGASRPQSATMRQNLREQSGVPLSDAEEGSTEMNKLTTHVWPKSRMLFSIVSKMSKEGALSDYQRGVLKDLILEYDQRLINCLTLYEQEGDRERLYASMREIANQTRRPR